MFRWPVSSCGKHVLALTVRHFWLCNRRDLAPYFASFVWRSIGTSLHGRNRCGFFPLGFNLYMHKIKATEMQWSSKMLFTNTVNAPLLCSHLLIFHCDNAVRVIVTLALHHSILELKVNNEHGSKVQTFCSNLEVLTFKRVERCWNHSTFYSIVLYACIRMYF